MGGCLVFFGFIATLAVYLFLDHVVRGWLLAHPNTWHRRPWVNGFRQLGKANVVIWLLLLWSCITDRWRPTFVTIIALILVSLCVCPLKGLVQRRRPLMLAAASGSSAPREQGDSWLRRVSFPSGDTAVAFAVAVVLPFFVGRPWRPILLAVAGGIGLLRVTSSVHYPSDVVAGAVIGVACGLCAMRTAPRWGQRDPFPVKGWWRLVVGLILVLVLPLVSPLVGLESLPIFLRIYGIPLAGLILVYLGGRGRVMGGTGNCDRM
ncbi:MAG: hypothetical protein A2Y77_18570 [Planctomycetes bacterium RBG_13_62_9]|nr:MAG: hypothetical protein A2Y77_18570 [Planctomycetes bacterium RBG_13_62_9]